MGIYTAKIYLKKWLTLTGDLSVYPLSNAAISSISNHRTSKNLSHLIVGFIVVMKVRLISFRVINLPG